MREREVEKHLREKVEGRGGMCVKFDPSVMPGMPDRIILLPGGVVAWAETKKPKGGRLDGLQKLRHKQLRAIGQRVEVVWTKEQADAYVDELLPGPA